MQRDSDATAPANATDPPYAGFTLVPAAAPRRPVVVASPHSGTIYPDELLAAARLDAATLRRSEDSFVDEIFGAAPGLGMPLLKCRIARAYVDVNREPWELDPAMFRDALPGFVNRTSPRVAVGLGTIARVVAEGQAIYRRKLTFAEVERRIIDIYHPYHAILEAEVAATVGAFGHCLLIDGHSMPSSAGAGPRPVDIVLGDRVGGACDPAVTATAAATFRRLGYIVALNAPYAGGFTTRHYGVPAHGRHTLQIEINRALYMDEARFERKPFLADLRSDVAQVLEALAALDLGVGAERGCAAAE
jgi:N-formylglutamate amidohydrolase